MKNLYKEYTELLERQQKEFNEIPMFFAFDNEQFEKNYKKYQEKHPETIGEQIYSFMSGGFATKDHIDQMVETSKRQREERQKYLANDEVLEKAFYREFWNREYGFAEDDNTVVNAVLDKNFEELTEREDKVYKQARKEYMEKFLEFEF